MTRRLLSQDTLPAVASGIDITAYDRKVLEDYLNPQGRLSTLPAQRKKLEAILRRLILEFEPGKRYSEKQVNEILSRFHEDTATLRRELVGYHLLSREGGGGDYWRTDDR